MDEERGLLGWYGWLKGEERGLKGVHYRGVKGCKGVIEKKGKCREG